MKTAYNIRCDAQDKCFNWTLRETRKRMGYTMKELAEATGIGRPILYAYELVRAYPSKENADKIAQVFHKSVEELFPKALREITSELRAQRDEESGQKLYEVIKQLEIKVEQGLASKEDKVRLKRLYSLEHPEDFDNLRDYALRTDRNVVEDEVSHTLLKERIDEVLCTLSDPEKEILTLRYGLGKTKCHTLEEVSSVLNISREMIKRIEGKAIRKLQHPNRSRKLESFLEGIND